MALIFIRTTIVFITLLVVMRLMGKRQIGEMQPFELVITLIIADLACIPMSDTSIPLLYGIVAIVSIYFLHQIVCFLDLSSMKMKKLIGGAPSVVMNLNGINDLELKKNNLDVSDLIESLRSAGFFSLDAVDYALYEANGKFSALPKQNYEQLQNSLPVIILDEGDFQRRNVEKTGKSERYFLDVLKERGYNQRDIFIMTVDGNGKVYLQRKKQKYEVFDLNWGERVW